VSGSGSPAILHARVPDFYASVERARLAQPDVRPILVGGDPRKRGKVQSASQEARASGVYEGMPMLDALALCPRARHVATDMAHYRAVSTALRTSLRTQIERIEPDGLGAAYLDARTLEIDPADLGRALVARVESELGLGLAVGAGPTKGVARLAARSAAAGEVRVVAEAEVGAFLDPLPVGELPRVGPRTAKVLAELGVSTVGQLRRCPAGDLERALGNHGLDILEWAQGRDREPVRSQRHPSSLSREQLLEAPGAGPDVHRGALGTLAAALESALARHDLRARRVALRVRLTGGGARTRSRTVAAGLVSAGEIASEAEALLERFDLAGEGVRGVRITLAGLAPSGLEERQLDLFG
jgi:DNA polymerase-4